MKFSKEKQEPFSSSYTRTALAKGWKIELCYNEYSNDFHFLAKKDNKAYNSCWDKKVFQDESSCIAAIEQWIKEQPK